MSSRIRPKAYKKSLVSQAECAEWSQSLSFEISDLLSDYRSRKISEAEFVAQYIICGLKILRPRDWCGGAHNNFSYILTKNPGVNIFLEHSLRSIPISVNRSLYYWSINKYPLKLFLGIPTEIEVLKMQVQGQRCVSCIVDPDLTGNYILNERDALSFALHDLIHADHFFKHPEMLQAQIGFSRWMLSLSERVEFRSWLDQDKHFYREFFYAASDMNSHPAHLVKYFKSILTAAILRKNHQLPNEKLSEIQNNRLKDWLFECAHIGNFDSNFYEMLKTLNSNHETPDSLNLLTQALKAEPCQI